MPDDFVGDVVSQPPYQALDRSGAELSYVAAFDAHGVVMVSYTRQAVPGGTVYEVKPAYNADSMRSLIVRKIVALPTPGSSLLSSSGVKPSCFPSKMRMIARLGAVVR